MDLEAINNRLDLIEKRIEVIELIAHPPVDWQKKIESIEGSFNRLYDLVKSLIKET